MANVNGQDFGTKPLHAHAYGNGFVEKYDMLAVAQIADIVFLGVIPAGTEVDLFSLILATDSASITCKVGYAPMVAADGPTAVDDYWFAAGKSLTTAGIFNSAAFPILFQKDVKITMTVAGALTTAARKTVVVVGKCVGVK